MQDNYKVLNCRLNSINESKERLEQSIKETAAKSRSLIADINSMKPRIKALAKKREDLVRYILSIIWFRKALWLSG